jgi:hypothetical protein
MIMLMIEEGEVRRKMGWDGRGEDWTGMDWDSRESM